MNSFKQAVKLSPRVLLYISLIGIFTACGSTTTSSKSSASSSGECVDFPFRKYKKTVTKIASTEGHLTYMMTEELIEHSKKFTKFKQTMEGPGYSPLVTIVETDHYIEDNYMHFTHNKTTASVGNSKSTADIEYDPFYRVYYEHVCKGQSWEDSFDAHQTNSDGEEKTYSREDKWTIVDVNVKKTIGIGEFNTFIVQRDENEKNKQWIDINSGTAVYAEVYRDEKHIATHELVEYSE